MVDQKEKNGKKKKQKATKTKPNKSEPKPTFLSKTTKPEKKGRMKMKTKKGKGKGRDRDQRKRRNTGPRLPNVLRKELGMVDSRGDSSSDSEGEEGVKGLYEVEEEFAEEELGNNMRYDEVDNYLCELSDDFTDEEVSSDEDILEGDGEDENEEDGGERHLRMLQGITGIPKEAFDEGEKKKREQVLASQVDVKTETISVHDLLAQLQGKSGYSSLRQRVQKQEKQPMTMQPPLPKSERDKIQRKVSDKFARKEITKWEGLVKRNREAPTLFFEQDLNLGHSTVGAIASSFEPRTEFEKQMAQLRQEPELVEAYKNDGARMLELNKVSVEDVIDRQNRLAKMRSLLFRHEIKSKRIKKIKSKTFHKIMKKEKQKAASVALEMDPEAAKLHAIKQEQKRAEERFTLKHKNSSKWAKRILKRGLDVQDDATRAAIAEQLQKHEQLKRKMNSMKENESSSDEESSDDEDDEEEEDETKRGIKALNKAKDKTAKVLNDTDEVPKKGLFALPFMERGLKKRQEEACEEARQALEDYDATLNQLEDEQEEEATQHNASAAKLTSKRSFGPAKKDVAQQSNKRRKLDGFEENTDNEDDDGEFEEASPQNDEVNNDKAKGVRLGTALLDEEQIMTENEIFKNLDDVENNVGPKTTYEVAIFAGGSFRKVNKDDGHSNMAAGSLVKVASKHSQDIKEIDQFYDTDSDTEMVEGFINTNSGTGKQPDYKLPSQSELVHRVFAGDDVAAEFERDKLETLNEENPEPEKPTLVPGWGQWTNVQKKRGVPDWMVREHNEKKRKREEALKKRKDAKFDHVIISETINKKAEKLMATSLPFPFTSKEAYEGNMRMPIGPDFNPASAISALNRPEIVKKPGLIIKPIQYEEVDPDENPDQPKRIIQGAKPKQSTKKKTNKGKLGTKQTPRTAGKKVKST